MCSATHARSEFPDSSDFEREKVEVQKEWFFTHVEKWPSQNVWKSLGESDIFVLTLGTVGTTGGWKKRGADDSHGRGQSQKYRIRHAKRRIWNFRSQSVKRCLWALWAATWPQIIQTLSLVKDQNGQEGDRSPFRVKSSVLKPTSTCKLLIRSLSNLENLVLGRRMQKHVARAF